MWKNVLKAPITIGRTRIGMKPLPDDEEDCCEMAKKEWLDYIINDVGFKDSGTFVKYLKNMDCERLYSYLTYISRDSEDLGIAGIKEATKILDKWNKCEGK